MGNSLSTQNEAGDNFVEMAMSLELGILNTMCTIDYILAPLSGLGCVKKVVTCWKLGHRVQLIPAAHPRDHLPVLVLIALRIRRTGQDQQRAHRWDFDRMATALQQGSTERVAFLKEVDQNLSDQAEQMERALTAPSAEDSWRLWIQAIVRAGKRFFSHTKALHTTEGTRQANRERWALLRNRQALRQRLGETAPQVDSQVKEVWTALHFRIRELGRKLRAAARRAQVQAEENMLRELQEAAQLGAKADVHMLCVQLGETEEE